MKGLFSKMIATTVVAAMLFTSGTATATETTPGKEITPDATLKSEAGLGHAPDVIRKEMKVAGYQLVKVNGNFKVYLSQGDVQKIVVEADEELVPEVKHFIVDNTLNIYTSDDVKKRITLWITLKDINNLNKYGKVRVIKQL